MRNNAVPFTGRCSVLLDVSPLGKNTLYGALKGLHLTAMGNTHRGNVHTPHHCPEGGTSIQTQITM
jgi:hypothetical protein